jgi:preprotein translocase SecE subunit
MFKFIRDALSEFEHVVWPTPNETRKYMYYNVATIIVLTMFLMTLGYVIQESLTAARKSIPHDPVVIENSDTVTRSELDEITAALEKKKTQSGATNTGVTVTVQTGVTAQ